MKNFFNIHLEPINKISKNIVSEGIHYDCELPPKKGLKTWKEFPSQMVKKAPKNSIDLIGERHGKMTIVGYIGRNSSQKTSVWLAKCFCGNYERRVANKWRKKIIQMIVVNFVW